VTPSEFLDALWREKPDDQYVLLWTWPDKLSHWFRDLGKAAEFAAVCNLDVYVGVGLAGADHGPHHRCKSEEITGLSSINADLDVKSEAHSTKPLPSTLADALSILPPALPPSLIVATGNGAHAWWMFKEPYLFESEQDRADVSRIVSRWHTMLRLNAGARGWAYDRLSDLARVLRVPGTQNHKDPAHPKDVVVHSGCDRRYNLSDFAEFLDLAGIPDPESQDRAAREWRERFADKPLVIDLNARIPDELLAAWMDPTRVDAQTAMRFRNTWNRQRHDLRDQSNSGYDMALADFGVTAGLGEQQIVDLILHHRAIHHQNPRTTLDYYRRTIGKALRREEDSAPGTPAHAVTSATAAPQGAPVPPTGTEAANHTSQAPPVSVEAPVDPAQQKVLLCEQVSKRLGINILRFVKFKGKEPTFHMLLEENETVEFDRIEKLIEQRHFRLAVAGAVNTIIPKVKPKEWELLAQKMLNACFIEEGDVQQEFVGGARSYVASYLSENGFIDAIEGQKVRDQKKPIVLRGRIAINASDLRAYINKSTFQNLSVRGVSSMLGGLAGKQLRVRGKKFREQSRWLLPLDEFDPKDYGREVGDGDE
jgi:hypothetical protein